MSIAEDALVEMARVLDEFQIPYMLIGGVAVGIWGEPRATLDVDLTLWVEPERVESTVEMLARRLALRAAKPLEMVQRIGVLPVQASNGVPVDLLFGRWPIEREAIERVVVREVSGVKIRVAPIDYLVFLKLLSDRPKDLTDAELLLRRYRKTVNLGWLRHQLAALADSTAQPDILNRFERLLSED